MWYVYTIEHYSAIKGNTFDTVLTRWMSPEPIIQSEVSQKDKYRILTHVYGIEQDGSNEPIWRAAMEIQKWRTGLWTQKTKEKAGRIERVALKHIHYHV